MKSIFAKSFQIGVYTIEFPNSRTVAKTRKGAVRIASTTLSTIMTSEYLKGVGFIPMSEYYYVRTSCVMNRPVPNGTHSGVSVC